MLSQWKVNAWQTTKTKLCVVIRLLYYCSQWSGMKTT